jgi:transposase
MESTGVYWKPVFNLLEGTFQEVLLVNPQHIKAVPGRKTDVKDCQWIAQLLQHGLLRASFVPAREQRELRDLTRMRTQSANEHTRVVNRIHKLLEDANVKLASVATDILGVSGRDMLRRLADGEENPQALAQLARKSLRKKIPQLERALQGHFTQHHRFVLKTLLQHLEFLEEQISQLTRRIEEQMRPFLTKEQTERLDEIPGVNIKTIQAVVAEIGVDMRRFPSHKHVSKWGGLCPGNNSSAGKQKGGKTTKGNPWLRRALAEAAWAAARTKDTYFSALYRRMAARRGKKRALVAVSHTLLVIIYHMLKHGLPYKDLGPDYLDRLHAHNVERYLVRRLQRLGYHVTLQRAA